MAGTRVFGGFIGDAFVGDLIAACPDLVEGFPYVLITSLDGSPPTELSNVIRALEEHAGSYQVLGGGVLLSGAATMRVARDYELFTHFDEVWFFREEPAVPKPVTVDIRGSLPPKAGREAVGADLARWMLATGCVAGLGDGLGLAYVTTEMGFARVLERLPNHDP